MTGQKTYNPAPIVEHRGRNLKSRTSRSVKIQSKPD